VGARNEGSMKTNSIRPGSRPIVGSLHSLGGESRLFTSVAIAGKTAILSCVALPLFGCIHPLLSVKAAKVNVAGQSFVKCVVQTNDTHITPEITKKADELCLEVQKQVHGAQPEIKH
jgi:hypothetical protein